MDEPLLRGSSLRQAERHVMSDAGFRRVVAALCVTEIVSFGVLYYAFTVLNPAIAADTGWPLLDTTFAFSLGQVVAALVGIPVGRVIDRRGPRLVMTCGSLLGVPAVCLIALAQNQLWFIGGWVLAGLSMSAVFYTPAFSAITHWGGARALGGLTAVTLVAGFASTIFGPLAAQLQGQLGWRGAFLVLAGVLGLLTVPAHWWGLRGAWVPKVHENEAAAQAETPGRPFVVLAVVLSLAALAEYGVVVQLVPLLVSRGLSVTSAAIVLGVGGAGQAAGRFGYGALAKQTTVVQRTSGMCLVVAATSALFPVVPPRLYVLLAVTIVAGLARGCLTLLQATAVPDRWGDLAIGRRNGLIAAPALITAAVAPFVGAAIHDWLGGSSAVFYLLAAAAVVAAVLVPFSMPTVQGPATTG